VASLESNRFDGKHTKNRRPITCSILHLGELKSDVKLPSSRISGVGGKYDVSFPGGLKGLDTKKPCTYEGVSKSFRTGLLEQELQRYSSLPLGAIVLLFCESV
jgi:hypothetical protein